jgi:hypothetical protein
MSIPGDIWVARGEWLVVRGGLRGVKEEWDMVLLVVKDGCCYGRW